MCFNAKRMQRMEKRKTTSSPKHKSLIFNQKLKLNVIHCPCQKILSNLKKSSSKKTLENFYIDEAFYKNGQKKL